MVDRVCWYCDSKTHMAKMADPVVFAQTRDREQTVTGCLFRCDNCSMPSLGMVVDRDGPPYLDAETVAELFELNAGIVAWHPLNAVTKVYEDVPQHVGAAASEAHACESIGAHRAAVQMARSVIEATAKDKEIIDGPLVAKIDELAGRGLIREHVRQAAHEVRYLGNEMAHGDFTAPVTAEDAEETLGLMAEVLAEVYQSPARVARRKAAREARAADNSQE